MQFLNLTNQFYDKKFGFRQGHSTKHALLKLTEKKDKLVMQENILVVFLEIFKRLLKQ